MAEVIDASVGLTISVDTEEDNWEPTTRDNTTLNIRAIPRVQRLCERLGARVTLFVTYQVACDPDAAAIIREVSASDNVEVAAHLHPWNTPPAEGMEERSSMLWQYPADSQASKVSRLKQIIHDNIGVETTAFRAGRFGFGTTTLSAIQHSGFIVDSSVTPLMSWREYGGPSFVRAPLRIYRPSASDVCAPAPDGRLIEVPITIGFTRFRQSRWRMLAETLYSPFARGLHLPGLANAALGLRRVMLSPETDTVADMLEVSRGVMAEGGIHLHMYFHSNTLVAGLTPFARTRNDSERIYECIEQYIDGLSTLARLRPCTVSEAATVLEGRSAV